MAFAFSCAQRTPKLSTNHNKRKDRNMTQVKIMITGSSPRNVNFRDGETLSDLVARLSTSDFPLNKVSSWYANGTPVGSAKTLALSPGMTLAGAPKVDGGR